MSPPAAKQAAARLWTARVARLSPHALGTTQMAKNSDSPADRRGSHEGVYGN